MPVVSVDFYYNTPTSRGRGLMQEIEATHDFNTADRPLELTVTSAFGGPDPRRGDRTASGFGPGDRIRGGTDLAVTPGPKDQRTVVKFSWHVPFELSF